MWSPTEIAAVIGGIAGAVALSKQGYDVFHERKKTKTAVEEALNVQPEVKRQLELGNVGEAVKFLSSIIESQAKHIDRQNAESMRQEGIIMELRSENEEMKERIETLEERLEGAV